MKEILGVVLAIALGAVTYWYVQNQRLQRNEPTGYRTNQQAGESSSGLSQQMPRSQAEDSGDASEGGARARELLATSSDKPPLSDQQRAAVARYFTDMRGNVVDPEDVSISIGASVPRQIALQPLPPEIVDVMQKYRGDEYFMAAGKLVVVEPKSRRIVAIVPLA